MCVMSFNLFAISLEPDGTETPALACIEAHYIPNTFDNANRDDI